MAAVTLIQPETPQQLCDAVAEAVAERVPMEIVGHGTKRGFGHPVQAAHTLVLNRLSGVTLYEPDELVLTAAAGTPLAEIEALLAANGQHLAFEPADLAPLLGGEGLLGGGPTIGGVVACNLAGPRRIQSGAARDHVLGFTAVSGRAEVFKSGGRVVKNVTGYDLSKLMTGSFGTLAVLAEVTVKVLPRPEKTRTVLIFGLDCAAAVDALTRALATPHEVSGAAFLPAPIAARAPVGRVAGGGRSVTALRVEGPGPSVLFRASALAADIGPGVEVDELHSHNSAALWRWLADVGPFAADPFSADRQSVVWRLSIPPSLVPALLRGLAVDDARYFLDWAGGLVWLALPPEAELDGGAARVRRVLAGLGAGYATLVRAPDALRGAVPVFQPQEPALAALTRRIKDSFDPAGVLNPGRLYPGT